MPHCRGPAAVRPDLLHDARPMHARVPLAAYACLAASMALVGSYVGLSKLLVAAFPVFLLAWLRFGIAAARDAALAAPRSPARRRCRPRPRAAVLESFLGNFLFSICMLSGIARSTALAAGVIMAAMPAVVAVLSRVFLGERIAPRVAAGIACAVAGIALRVAGAREAPAAPATLLGNALLFGAVVCEASYVVIGKRLAAQVSARRISALVNLWGLALVTPFALWQALGFDFRAVAAPMWVLLLFYAHRGQRGHGLALDDAGCGTCRRRRPACSRCCCRSPPPRSACSSSASASTPAQAAAFALALAGVVLATWRRRAAGPLPA